MSGSGTLYKIRTREWFIEKTYAARSATEALAKSKWFVLRGEWCEVTEATTGEVVHGYELIRRAT